jgi:hypothetical protein
MINIDCIITEGGTIEATITKDLTINVDIIGSGPQGEKGKSLEFTWNGTQLGIRQEGDATYQYVNLKGDSGSGANYILYPGGESDISDLVVESFSYSEPVSHEIKVYYKLIRSGDIVMLSIPDIEVMVNDDSHEGFDIETAVNISIEDLFTPMLGLSSVFTYVLSPSMGMSVTVLFSSHLGINIGLMVMGMIEAASSGMTIPAGINIVALARYDANDTTEPITYTGISADGEPE